MKSGNLNFLEPSGPLQACKGIALTFSGICLATFPFVTVNAASVLALA